MQKLFSVVMCIDQEMSITYASSTLRKYLPDLDRQPKLKELFDVLRPSSLETFDDATKSINSMCLMTAKNGQFAIRGQWIRTRFKDQDAMCFCGAPWLFWMSSNCPDVRLGLGDFAPQDVQLDQLFFMSTEKAMVADLEKMNIELMSAKEELEATYQAQHRLFAQMSHEMRTPLNGVVSALSLMQANPLDPRQDQLVSLAQSSSRNLMEVINYVLDLSKLELAGEDGHTMFNLLALINSTAEIVQAKAQEKSLEFGIEPAPDLPLYCKGSPSRVRQVLLNLLINAIKFTDKGSVKLRVCLDSSDAQQSILHFEVVDTGVGISSGDLEYIFQPFWSGGRYDSSHPDAGTGLGLDIVRRNIEYMGGSVGVTSTLGVGSTFWFNWPVTSATAADALASAIDYPVNANSDTTIAGHILLVDDNQSNLLLGSMLLESLGANVSTVAGGAEAVKAVLQQNFDLVLMDIHMPEVNGLEATRQIRESFNAEQLPIVALTALAYEKEKGECLASGMNSYLTKPIVKAQLVAELSKWLNKDSSSPVADDEHHDTPNAIEDAPLIGLLDHTVLEVLIDQIGRENLEAVLVNVITESSQRWDELVEAGKYADKVALQCHVHSLSSIFRSVGLMPAGEALVAIEILLREGDEAPEGWLHNLEQLKSDSLAALTQALHRLSEKSSPAPNNSL